MNQEARTPRFRWTIAWRMGLGFGLFFVAVAVLFGLTSTNLSKSRALGEHVEMHLVPSLQQIEMLDQTIADTRVLIKHWLKEQSRADDPEKRALRRLMAEDIPAQIQALKDMEVAWSPSSRKQLDSLEIAVLDRLFVVYGEIMRVLPDFASYDDPRAFMQAQLMAMEGGELQVYTELVESKLAALSQAQNEALSARMDRMAQLGSDLNLYVGNVALVVLVLGIMLGVIVTRSIVQPVKELKRALLYMGRGVQPDREVRVTPDEIGDMAVAVNRLATGLARTQQFSQEVGSGRFDTPYEPLSEEDELGKALLQMRNSLAENERELENKVEVRTEELAREKSRVETVLGDLQDSINYALRIQQAILPTDIERREIIHDSAVFYQPRDVVSGDFYWFKTVGRRRLVAAIDCTGHGVPGAFMSLVGYNALDRVSKVYSEPQKILDNLNTQVLGLLRKDVRAMADIPSGLLHDLNLAVEGSNHAGHVAVQDGMDLAMVAINWENMTLEFSGANNPLYIIRQGEVIERKADKHAICSFEPGSKSYTVHTLELEAGDNIFLATDGFVDQFGGPHGKKFMRRRFRELLVEAASMPISDQENFFRTRFDAWRGQEAQVDDVLVVSVKVP
jgi:serine phosphatase RsbU (regulator of sigma subunit)